MMLSWRPIVPSLMTAVQHDEFWRDYLAGLHGSEAPSFEIHLAIFVEPYLQFILEGRKTIESRFSTRRFVPYERVKKGDVILLKRSSGPIVGLCQVANVWFYDLDPTSWAIIRERFAEAICAQDASFWSERAHTSFATLIRIHRILPITPIEFTKRDRRGWVILTDLPQPKQLKLEGL
jgi:ASC-1-like (ASCH) protein